MKSVRRRGVRVVCMACLCGLALQVRPAWAQPVSLSDVLAKLHDARPEAWSERESRVRAVVDRIRPGEQQAWQQVLAFADDHAVPIDIRDAVIRGASAKLDAGMASQLLRSAHEWARAPQSGAGPERVRLAMVVVETAEQATWRNALVGTDEYLALMEAVLVGPPYPQSDYQSSALRLWAGSTAPPEPRARSAERIVMAMRKGQWVMDEVADQLDPAAIERFREIVSGARSVDEFHWGAAAAMAQRADKAAGPLLQEKARLFASQGSRLAGEVAAMVKRIQVQASAESVLAAIDEEPANGGATFAAWLVRRAPQVGVTTQVLREHVVRWLERCREEIAHRDFRSRSTARAIRAAAQHVGALGSEEYPDFKPQHRGVP